MANPSKDRRKKKKKGSIDQLGVAHIKATFNNTHITLTDKSVSYTHLRAHET